MDIFNLSQEQKERLKVYSISENLLIFRQQDTYLRLDRAKWIPQSELRKPLGVANLNEGVQIQDQGISPTRLSIEQLQVLVKWLSQLPNIKLYPNAI